MVCMHAQSSLIFSVLLSQSDAQISTAPTINDRKRYGYSYIHSLKMTAKKYTPSKLYMYMYQAISTTTAKSNIYTCLGNVKACHTTIF